MGSSEQSSVYQLPVISGRKGWWEEGHAFVESGCVRADRRDGSGGKRTINTNGIAD
jgi:hypothetical protein